MVARHSRICCGKVSPRLTHTSFAIPRQEHLPDHGNRLRRGISTIKLKKCIQLRQMRVIILPVDLPDKRFSSPLGTQKRILAPHKIEIAATEQGVEIVLRQKWNRLDSQLPALPRPIAPQHLRHRRQRLARWHQATYRLTALRKGHQQFAHRCCLVAEQTDRQRLIGGKRLISLGKGVQRRNTIALAQQPARSGDETRKIKMLYQRQRRVGRCQTMAGLRPGFRRQVFQVDPARTRLRGCHLGNIVRRQFAGEGFDNHVKNRVHRR